MVRGKKYGLLILVLANLLCLLVCWQQLRWQLSNDYQVKRQAVATAVAAQQVIGERLLGVEYTPITTTLGAEEAKRLAQNPNFAAVAVELLAKSGVEPGDKVAVNLSASFPALNVAVLAAVDALKAEPVIVSSVGASTWGANRPDYTWLDMESALVKAGLWNYRSQAVSLGGGSDRGEGLTEEGKLLLKRAVDRSQVHFLASTSVEDAVAQRLNLYQAKNGGSLPKTLVNVGGNHVIFGTHGHDTPLRQGLSKGYKPSLAHNNGLAAAFLQKGRSVIHFINIKRLAAHYDITAESAPGTGKIFYQLLVPGYLRGFIFAWVIAMLLILYYGKRKEWWQ